MDSEKAICIAGAGDIHTGKLNKINIEEINEWIAAREMERIIDFLESQEPDYLTLLELANDLKKIKAVGILRKQ